MLLAVLNVNDNFAELHTGGTQQKPLPTLLRQLQPWCALCRFYFDRPTACKLPVKVLSRQHSLLCGYAAFLNKLQSAFSWKNLALPLTIEMSLVTVADSAQC